MSDVEPMRRLDPDFIYPLHRYVPDVTTKWVTHVLQQLGELTSWPRYGSIEWHLLPVQDPRRYAAVMEAAERWRKAAQEHHRREVLADLDPEAWHAEVVGDARAVAARAVKPLRTMRTARALKDARATYGPVREVRATPGWTPVAIPGRPGWWRHLIDGRQVDMPTREPQEVAA
jgi:hypothetical protein